jgi:ferredoxin
MAIITFSSPVLKKDVTVYATAGDRRTLLAVAQEHKIPLHYECQNGECGSCAVQVFSLNGQGPKGVHLTEKEKTVLVLAGKVSRDELARLEVDDIAPNWRMACQYMLLDEDILVKF